MEKSSEIAKVFTGLSMRLLIHVAAIIGLGASAMAQDRLSPTPEAYVAHVGGGAQIVPAGDLTIDGRKVSCGRFPTVLDPNLNDFAVSYPLFIVLRPDAIATVTTTVALWIYYHECGHLHGINDESQADCFAVKRGQREKWLTPEALDGVCAFIRKGRASAAHLSGPERCTRMRYCFKPTGAPIAGQGALR
jgi:hypothetical protein